MPTRAAIGLGSNLGDRARHIAEALGALSELGDLVATSALYQTAPIGGPEQGPYLNAVAVIDTNLSARDLLEACLEIEQRHGRERRERWGPRTLDLDIVLYGAAAVDEPGLTVPHPELANRRFVLEPLVEAWPNAALPDGTQVADLLPTVADQAVRRMQGPVPSRSFSLAAIGITIVGALLIWWIFDWLIGLF
ncbi:MAG: 2-amino-4-hydroxy-6-hydroxymethyldihydropteridine diphosphokinase [Acidimicrobiia bacterium]|nr:2-amino-4-hydroxy-6-hydroxymethyldihydropteridine diphosphokinase [Acidimicrobiia bacterium]